MTTAQKSALALLALALATLPFWIARVGLYQYLGIEILVWGLYALSYNLLLGYTGLPSFGHGAYFGVGAYAFGLTQKYVAANLWIDLGGAVLAAALCGALVATFISHRRGIYYALMTIAFCQIFWFVAIKWHSVTGGEDGLLGLKRLPVELGVASIPLTDNVSLYYFVLAVSVAVTALLWRMVHSPYGRVVQAIRQNETRVAFVGYHVWLYKWLAFVVSAALSGLAGALFALAQLGAFPDVMSLHSSGFVVMMTLIGGGLVSFWGPLIGAAIFFIARDALGALTSTWSLWYGLMFMAIVVLKPEGVAGMFQALQARRRARAALPAPSRAGT
ncbi:MAG: branched-chain amino acid ABC transporter permease [Betaproteobacteria bacterium]